MIKLLFLSFVFVMCTACTPQLEHTENLTESMPKDCQEYFDGLRELAKDNINLATKFGAKLATVEKSWQSLNQRDREKFSEQCIIRNKQLKELQKTPEMLDEFLDKL